MPSDTHSFPIKKGEEGFWETFRDYPVPDEWAVELYDYFMCGLLPGSFFEALYANDLRLAAIRTHPSNQWLAIVQVMKWISANAPASSWGNLGNVKRWISDEDAHSRRIIHEAKGWKLPEDQLIWKIVSE